MPKPESFPIEKIYVPVKRRKAIKPQVVEEIAGSILDIGQQTPISVRLDGDRLVLVEGLHRLEACKALGETTIVGIVVSAEDAQQRTLLSEGPEADAERDKMARLKKLRLEKEAAESSITALNKTDKERARAARGAGENSRTSPSRASGPTPKKTLSEWIAQQKRDGGRY
ncbi:ParB N-terminal domain-containing protein [Bradyrhizobium sp. BEA-2-5]|uniref:ParB N-terminal domain-containing protein n=1 Tax=Bradyrhizobium sp. BEA-2-5 TaxID=3080015 RepID=UPI00293F1F0C|nr:ParB N-terminal domain-containing protein [Bradyrhizobium sp. BEA-2-5]WOH84611.1 ParB N-terminal domain-containing protein [Bradyrhizobium sp. BEA-2-5]